MPYLGKSHREFLFILKPDEEKNVRTHNFRCNLNIHLKCTDSFNRVYTRKFALKVDNNVHLQSKCIKRSNKEVIFETSYLASKCHGMFSRDMLPWRHVTSLSDVTCAGCMTSRRQIVMSRYVTSRAQCLETLPRHVNQCCATWREVMPHHDLTPKATTLHALQEIMYRRRDDQFLVIGTPFQSIPCSKIRKIFLNLISHINRFWVKHLISTSFKHHQQGSLFVSAVQRNSVLLL